MLIGALLDTACMYVTIAVIAVASLVDKTRGRTRIMSYAEANRVRRELLELATAGFMRLVQVTNGSPASVT